MATLKGTWRFHDVLTYTGGFQEDVTFSTTAIVNIPDVYTGTHSFDCIKMVREYAGEGLAYYAEKIDPIIPGYDASGSSYVYSGDGWNSIYGDGAQTITFPEEQEVSNEFYEWFTANAVEQKQISGVWKFKDAVFCHPYETYQIGMTYQEKIGFLKAHGALCEPIDLSSISEGLYTNCFAMGNTFGDLLVDGQPTSFYAGVYLGVRTDGTYTGINVVPVEQICCQHINLGSEPQYVSVDFYNWLTENATQPTATVQYNGSTIANLFGGQTATLKCAGMRMASNVVVNVDVACDPVLEELTATENGTYAPGDGIDGYSSVTVDVPQDTSNEDGLVTRIPTTYTNDRVTEIGAYAFRQYDILEDAHFQAVTIVRASAFYNCTNLAVVEFGTRLIINSQAFSGCSSLTSVILRSKTLSVLNNSNAFTNTPIAGGTGFIYVDNDLVEDYKAETNWVNYADQIKPISELEG